VRNDLDQLGAVWLPLVCDGVAIGCFPERRRRSWFL
jgi:hypothetical protein